MAFGARETVKTAPTAEEAINLALEELHTTRDRVDFQVVKVEETGVIFKKKAVTVWVGKKRYYGE